MKETAPQGAPPAPPKIVRDYTHLTQLDRIANDDINGFIKSRCLEVFVCSDCNIYYKDFANSYDAAFKRSLQEIRWRIRDIGITTDRQTLTIPVEIATWESFQNWLLSSRGGNANPDDEKQKIKYNVKVKNMLDHLIDMGGSDLHIFANRTTDSTQVKMRINGLLKLTATWNYDTAESILRAIWNNNDNVHREESGINNGSFYHKHSHTKKEFMVRMTESPEVRGTVFVARVRDPTEIRPIDQSGYTEQQQNTIFNLLSTRSGLISINGPTNSGKSTTLSAMLALLSAENHIVEIGDPVETHLPGVRHIELNDKYGKGSDGASGKNEHLKAILGSTVRQDPDILALTEMRDPLTATAATQLASQGKLVLTTMHTESFITAFERLQRFGMKKEDITAPGFLRGFVSQRLLPMLCPHCKLSEPPPGHEKLASRNIVVFGPEDCRKLRFRNHKGCAHCHETGVSSRVICAETVEIDSEVREIARDIVFRHDDSTWRQYAEHHKITNIHQHAFQLALSGLVDTAIVEEQLGRFNEANLAWLWRGKRRPRIASNVSHLTPHPQPS